MNVQVEAVLNVRWILHKCLDSFIIDGPVNSLEDCRALLSSCGRKATQDFLVSIVVFVHVVCAHANLYAENYLMCNKFYIMLVGLLLRWKLKVMA